MIKRIICRFNHQSDKKRDFLCFGACQKNNSSYNALPVPMNNFNSTAHQDLSGNSSVGRARPCQGRGREFESRFPLQIENDVGVKNPAGRSRKKCGNSSVGRAQPCQGWGREFESRFPLQIQDGGFLAKSARHQKSAERRFFVSCHTTFCHSSNNSFNNNSFNKMSLRSCIFFIAFCFT